jgi:phosphatidylglycerophosphatase A
MTDTLDQQNPNKNNSIPFLTKFIATGFYSGYSPVAPGTAGSVVGILFFLIPGFGTPIPLATAVIIGFFIGTYTSNRMEKRFGEDPSIVVIDEIVGMWISLLFLPNNLFVIFTAFILFRIFDIVKPQPARYMEKFPHGWGIMLDDVVAGIYANAATQILILIIPNITG